MAAPFKRTRTMKITEIANEVISAVKNEISKKTDDVRETKVEVILCGHGARPFGNYLPYDYRDVKIKVGKQEWGGLDDYDVRMLKNELNKHVGEFDNVVTEDVFFSYGNFTPDIPEFPTKFRMLMKPCKEFVELTKLVERKYGVRLKVDDLYKVRLFGKSGRYGESGERYYTAFNPKACIDIIDYIKAFGGANTEFSIHNYDDIDTDYSARHLTECYGFRERSIMIRPRK